MLVLVVVCAFSRFSLSLHSLISNLLYSLLSLLSYVLYCSFCSPLLPLPLSIVYLPYQSSLPPSFARSPFFSDCSISILISRSSLSLSLPPRPHSPSLSHELFPTLYPLALDLDHSRPRSLSVSLTLARPLAVQVHVCERSRG